MTAHTLRRSHALVPQLLIVALIVLLARTHALQAGMDFERAALGGPTPFSSQMRDVASPWELFKYPFALTAPTNSDYLSLSEPGMGANVGVPLGQLMLYSGIEDRGRRVINDRLAFVVSPQVLYLDPYEPTTGTPTIPPVLPEIRYPLISGPGPVASSPGQETPEPWYPDPGPPPFVPEPAAATILGLGGLWFWHRRRVREVGTASR